MTGVADDVQFLNNTVETMTPYLMRRSAVIYGNQQKRCRATTGADLPYTLNMLRANIICPAINDPRCVYCKLITISESSFQIDHKNPLCRGGSWSLSNLILCCEACNKIKGALNIEEYMALRELVFSWNPFAGQDLFRRLKIGGNPMAARLLAGGK